MKFCAPRDQQNGPRWMITFDDADRGVGVYDTEDEAREAWWRASTMGWNCRLWTLAEHKDRRYPR